MNREKIVEYVDRQLGTYQRIAREIHARPEVSNYEFFACETLSEQLRREGFEVKVDVAGHRTGFDARYRSKKDGPVVVFLAEYDALGGLGHGCGHNLFGATSALAAAALLQAVDEVGGEVRVYGTPGEEGGENGSAKGSFVREGFLKDVDAALCCHPGAARHIRSCKMLGCAPVDIEFWGQAAHAAGAPELGRSALDAVELMNIGVQFLREHMTDDARIHYAILDAGGRSPNVVQSASTVLYMVRSKHVAEAVKLQARVDKIADGAALMTETSYTRKFIDGTADCLPNRTLETLMHENFAALGVPQYTPEELDFAKKLAATYSSNQAVPGTGSRMQADYARKIRALQQTSGHAMNDFLLPYFTGEAFRAGSTDVGDVSWLCPTAQCSVASIPNGCPGHSWQIVSCGTTSIAHKAALHAGRVIACTAIDLFAQPERLAQAKAEFDQAAEGGYVCPIPPDAVPVVAD